MLLYLFFGLLFFAVTLFAGTVLAAFITNPVFEKKGNEVLFKVLLGIMLISSFYASTKTHLSSVFLLFFVSILFLIKPQKIKFSFDFASIKHAWIFIFYLFLTFGWQLLYQNSNAFIFNHDQIYYSMLANMLAANGVETVYTHPVLNLGFYGNAPYHYLELWLTAFLKTVFNVPGDYTFVFLVIPFFSALSCYSLHINFGEKLKLNDFYKVLLFFAVLHCTPIVQEIFLWTPKIGPVIQSVTVNPFLSPISFKLLVALPFIVYIFSLKDFVDKRLIIVFLYFLLLINFTVGVCFWISLGIYLFYPLLINFRNFNRNMLDYLILTTLYGIFYFVTGSKIYNNLNFWTSLLGDWSYFNTRFNILAGVGICILLLVVFYTLLLKLFVNKFFVPERDVMVFLFLVMITGTILWALFYNLVDAIQFCNNAICILHIIFWFISVIYIIQSPNFVSISLLIVWWLYISILPLIKTSKEELISTIVKEEICQKISQIGFTGLDSNIIKSDPFFNNSTINFNLYYAYSRPESYYTCSPGMLFKKYSKCKLDSSHQYQRQIEDLLVYYKLKSANAKNLDDNQIILAFAKDYRVNHIYLKPGEKIPGILKPFVSERTKIGETDSLLFFNIMD